ncbi:MAG: flagellar basal-body rod protein FlgG [Alphaproteobacteria bacterium]|nr:flagellar basal-body rod protein FlgG [Alphaproteobacteria bacterium]MDX5369967.1 flagellar basal-body rod protein FlgG [Alphaproteobacteria bacterium]MDX5464542.1 flagellar basal-body rod protein FlgG [Alphaproteobacteria bacterium]
MRALQIAATGMAAQQKRVEVISNNMANMNTTAYSTRRAEFADLHYQQIRQTGAPTGATGTVAPAGVQIGLGVRASAVSMDIAQGALRQTGGDLDMAIEGRGWFEVELPTGDSAFTRDGSFKQTADGLIVTSEGYPLVPQVTIPQDARSISINADGEVHAYFTGVAEAQLIGRITLAQFTNEKGLEAIGSNMFTPTEASGDAIVGDPGIDGRGRLRQGYLEQSSVDAVAQITDLIEAQRGYELNSKVISAADQMMASASQIR